MNLRRDEINFLIKTSSLISSTESERTTGSRTASGRLLCCDFDIFFAVVVVIIVVSFTPSPSFCIFMFIGCRFAPKLFLASVASLLRCFMAQHYLTSPTPLLDKLWDALERYDLRAQSQWMTFKVVRFTIYTKRSIVDSRRKLAKLHAQSHTQSIGYRLSRDVKHRERKGKLKRWGNKDSDHVVKMNWFLTFVSAPRRQQSKWTFVCCVLWRRTSKLELRVKCHRRPWSVVSSSGKDRKVHKIKYVKSSANMN